MKGLVWGMMTQIPHIVDMKPARIVKILLGSE
jgi:hypothetical protein